MKLTNGQIKEALDAMEQLCGGGNRLPTLAALRADRIREALAAAWAPCDRRRQQLVKDHGVGVDQPKQRDLQAFLAAYQEMLPEERELELEALTTHELAAGWFRDPETGRKESELDLSPRQRGLLLRLGVVVEPPSTNGDGHP